MQLQRIPRSLKDTRIKDILASPSFKGIFHLAFLSNLITMELFNILTTFSMDFTDRTLHHCIFVLHTLTSITVIDLTPLTFAVYGATTSIAQALFGISVTPSQKPCSPEPKQTDASPSPLDDSSSQQYSAVTLVERLMNPNSHSPTEAPLPAPGAMTKVVPANISVMAAPRDSQSEKLTASTGGTH